MVAQGMVQAMAKKKTTTDGRRNRYQPITGDELTESAEALNTLAGKLIAAADEMAELEFESVKVDGRNLLPDGIASIRLVVNRVKTALFEAKLNME